MSEGEVRSATHLTLRPAAADDMRLFWEWANDRTVRNNAFNPEPIPWELHVRWFGSCLASPGTRIWVLEADGKPAGQIRYDRSEDGGAEISFSVAQECRGRGYGTEMIRRTCPLALSELNAARIVAVAFAENAPSCRAFLACGFQAEGPLPIQGRSCCRFTWTPPDTGAGEMTR